LAGLPGLEFNLRPEELERRLSAYEWGEMKSVPVEEVFRKLKAENPNKSLHYLLPLLHNDIIFSIIGLVSKADKILQQMQNNPLDWRIDSLKTVASAYSIEWRQRGTSHIVFVRNDGRTLPVPAHRPIKPVYKKFVDFVVD